jgi:benzodiazapine receptor
MFKLAISIAVCHMAGIIGGLFTRNSIPVWYESLKKPFFTPPDWVFGPAWIALYTMMGIAVYAIWRKGLRAPGVKTAMAIFIFQLTLNSLWSVVFFGGRSIVGGMVVIVLLWLAIAWTMATFFKISKTAFLLIMPYILWVSFALVLN